MAVAAAVAGACGDVRRAAGDERLPYLNTDSMGVVPPYPLPIELQARPELVENSAATLSRSQPGVFFTINDSGNEPTLFALDTTGADRGAWQVLGARNVDWESASVGPCAAAPADSAAPNDCVYIGDTGDNSAERRSRDLYRVREPAARQRGFTGTVAAQRLTYTYSDQPHDVEAMYVAPNGDAFLITKRRLLAADATPRPALVFRIPASAWTGGTPAVAQLVDSLPIVPGSAPMREITDAALSPDGRLLAVRTYAQVYVFAADSSTGRIRGAIPPSVCNIVALGRWQGEGIAWFGHSGTLLLTSEGQRSPMFAVDCPIPRSE